MSTTALLLLVVLLALPAGASDARPRRRRRSRWWQPSRSRRPRAEPGRPARPAATTRRSRPTARPSGCDPTGTRASGTSVCCSTRPGKCVEADSAFERFLGLKPAGRARLGDSRRVRLRPGRLPGRHRVAAQGHRPRPRRQRRAPAGGPEPRGAGAREDRPVRAGDRPPDAAFAALAGPARSRRDHGSRPPAPGHAAFGDPRGPTRPRAEARPCGRRAPRATRRRGRPALRRGRLGVPGHTGSPLRLRGLSPAQRQRQGPLGAAAGGGAPARRRDGAPADRLRAAGARRVRRGEGCGPEGRPSRPRALRRPQRARPGARRDG